MRSGVPEPTSAYRLPAGGHACEGWSYGRGFGEYVRTRVRDRCADRPGTADLLKRMQERAPGFGSARMAKVLAAEPPGEPWRAGECIAECFLEDQKGASLPNPRREKNPKASQAGADLVGVSREKGGALFLFGEVKTTGSDSSPPRAAGRMVSQLQEIASSESKRSGLIRWLGFRALGSDLEKEFAAAASSYHKGRYMIVGALIRDTKPRKSDVSAACAKVREKVGAGALSALYALYLPVDIGLVGSAMAGRADA